MNVDNHELGRAICDALGLKRATSVVIDLKVGQPVTVTATVLLDELEGAALVRAIKRGKLVPLDQ